MTAVSLTVTGSKSGVLAKTFEGVEGKIHNFHFTFHWNLSYAIETKHHFETGRLRANFYVPKF